MSDEQGRNCGAGHWAAALVGLVLAAPASAVTVTNYDFLGASMEVVGVDPTNEDPAEPGLPLEIEAVYGVNSSLVGVDGGLEPPIDPATTFANNALSISFSAPTLVTQWVDTGSPYPTNSSISFVVTNNGRALHDVSVAFGVELDMFVPAQNGNPALNDIGDGELELLFNGAGIGNGDNVWDAGESILLTFFLGDGPEGTLILPSSQSGTVLDFDFEPGVYLTGSMGPVPVPLPAAAWLLLSGLGVVGAVSRRKPAAAA